MTSSDDAVWDAFRHTSIVVRFDDGPIEVAPAPYDVRGAFPNGVAGPLHVLTAWNPHGVEASPDFNTAAGARLAGELLAHPELQVWPTTGFGANSDWHEDGFTIAGLTESEAIGLAVRYEQRAIFAWADAPGGFRLIACDGSADEARGWTSRPMS